MVAKWMDTDQFDEFKRTWENDEMILGLTVIAFQATCRQYHKFTTLYNKK